MCEIRDAGCEMQGVDKKQLNWLVRIYREAPVGLCFLDTNLRYVHINEWLAAINGLSVEEHLGRTISEVLPDVAAGVTPQFRSVIETGKPILDGTVEAATLADPGTKRHFEHTYHAIKSDNGDVIGVSCIVQEVTKRKRAEELLRRRELELTHANRLSTLGEIIAGTLHEINQPLYAISNYIGAFERIVQKSEFKPDRQLAELITEVRQASERANQIIKRLRRFATRVPSDRRRSRVDEIIADSLEMLQFLLSKSKISVTVKRVPDDNRYEAIVDRVQIEQVSVNLLCNACEAMEATAETDRCITVLLSRTEESVEVAVQDRGIGLPDDSTRIFDAFFTTKEAGMGMGLAISKTIVEEHGGRIWWTANPKGGATFHFTLPLANERQ
jgi:PAS domain S-box-containing protein